MSNDVIYTVKMLVGFVEKRCHIFQCVIFKFRFSKTARILDSTSVNLSANMTHIRYFNNILRSILFTCSKTVKKTPEKCTEYVQR